MKFLWHIHSGHQCVDVPFFSVKYVNVQYLCLATNTWEIEDKSSYLCPFIRDCFCLTRVCYLLTYIWCSREVHRNTSSTTALLSPFYFSDSAAGVALISPQNFPFLFKRLCCCCNQSFLQRPDIALEPDFAGNFQ